MSETIFQKKVLDSLSSMKKRMDSMNTEIGLIKKKIDGSRLSEDDKEAIHLALKEEKQGKLFSKKLVF